MASSSRQTSPKDSLAIKREQELVFALDEITEDEDHHYFSKIEPFPFTLTAANSRLNTCEGTLLFFKNRTRGLGFQDISQVSNHGLMRGRALACIRAQALDRINALATITSLQWYLKYSDDIDFFYRSSDDIEIEMQSLRSLALYEDADIKTAKLGKTFLGLTAQAGAALIGYGLNSSSSRASSLLLYFVVVANMLGFLGSLAGILLRPKSKVIAGLMEAIGSLFAAVGFFGMTAMFLPQNFIWVSGLGCAAVLAIYAHAFLK